ncbi:hypothetical protein BOX15_Mlig026605g1 [Macrostomum lignano]|uniref:Uncharacterized protein n=1 Tax=Macrostomum lignano TaxID=282301 RepID=A0A267G2L7_9PLAT|nr:hypothetical protein BOX15_Mlig026605g1 [Macrostomum lignano]
MPKFYRKLFHRRRSKVDEVAKKRHGCKADPGSDSSDSSVADGLDEESATPCDTDRMPEQLSDQLQNGSGAKPGRKKKKNPTEPYVPSCVKVTQQARLSCRCPCGCNCSSDRSSEWRPRQLKLSKCAGVFPSILAAGMDGDTDEDEEAEAAEVQHRRDKQWFNFQLANGTEGEGYRLGPR